MASSGDTQVAANQAAAAKLGISIPGVGGGSSRSSAPSRGQPGWIDPIDAPGDTTFTSRYGQPTDAQIANASSPGVPKTITSSNLTPAPSVTLPPPPPPSNAGTQAMTAMAGTAAAATTTTPATTPTTTTDDATTAFQTYLKSIQAPPDTAAMYQKDLNASGVTTDQQAVNTYQAQLNAITAKAQADKLSLVGTGNGVPNAIIGGQQAEIDREAAIQALPVSAQLSAAQGNLTEAQNSVDTLFKLQVADAQNRVAYQNSLVTAVYNFATSEQKAQLDALTTKNNQDFTTQQNNLNYAQSLATAALSNGQSGLAAQLMKLDPSDPNYRTNIATLAGGIQAKAGSVSLADQKTSALSSLSDFVQNNNNGTQLSYGPVIDKNGNITPEALKNILAAAPQMNLSISDVLTTIAPFIYAPGGVADPKYGLTAAEAKLVNAAPSS